MSRVDIAERGRRVVRMERDALDELEGRIGGAFVRAVELIAASKGRVIVTGVGKSGLIGRKIAATLTSTGGGCCCCGSLLPQAAKARAAALAANSRTGEDMAQASLTFFLGIGVSPH